MAARGGPFLIGAHVRTLDVPEADRRELQRRARDRGAPAREVERARIVLLAADGGPGQQIAAMVGCAEGTVVTWRRRYAARGLILQRQLWRCLSAGSVVSAAGLGLSSSPPPGPVGGGVEGGSRSADEGFEQPSQFGHGQRDELAGSGGGPPFSAVARVADR